MCQIEEIDVCLHVAGCKQFDAERFRGDFFFQLEIAFVGEVVATACQVVGGAGLFGSSFAGVLV